MNLNLKNPLVFFDLETTGTNITTDRIIELAYVKVFPNGKTEEKDMNGGTKKVMNYDLIPKEGIRKPFFIAGGLHSKNIKEITEKVHLYGIDISSVIETDGYKDLKKMKEIMQITGGRHE